MKKLICVIWALAMLFSFCACGTEEESGQDSAAVESEEIKEVSYDKSEGKLVKAAYYNANGLNYSTVEYEYDGYGRISKESYYGENHAPQSYIQYEYSDDGLLLSKTDFEASSDVSFDESYNVNYSYDENGKLICEEQLSGGELVYKTEYSYDENGNLLNEKHYEGDFLAAEYSYTYNSDGSRDTCTRNEYGLESVSTDKYAYDEKGRLLSVKEECEGDENVSGIEYSYDEYGSEISKTVYDAQGNVLSATSCEYTYDDAGNVIKSVVMHSDGSVGSTVKYTWEYSKG